MKHDDQTVFSRQQDLIRMIFEMGEELPEGTSIRFKKGLSIYQNNLLMTATRTLSLNYPVLEKMLSHDTMIAITREFLKKNRPDSGDWAEWGGGLSSWLKTTPLAQEDPFIPDVAKLEWLVHKASRSVASNFNASSFKKFSGRALEHAHIKLASSIGLIKSSFPIDVLWRAHQPTGDEFQLDANALERELADSPDECFLIVYQRNQVAKMARLSSAEFSWYQGLSQNQTLASLIDLNPDFDFVSWLPRAIQDDLVEEIY